MGEAASRGWRRGRKNQGKRKPADFFGLPQEGTFATAAGGRNREQKGGAAVEKIKESASPQIFSGYRKRIITGLPVQIRKSG